MSPPHAPQRRKVTAATAAAGWLVAPLEEQARVQWEKVIDAAKSQGISNEWTQLAQERLHDFVSQDEFPVLRNELREGTETP